MPLTTEDVKKWLQDVSSLPVVQSRPRVVAAVDNLLEILDEKDTDEHTCPLAVDPFTLDDDLVAALLDAEIDHAEGEEAAASKQRSAHFNDEAGLYFHGKVAAWEEARRHLEALRFRLMHPHFARQMLRDQQILKGGDD